MTVTEVRDNPILAALSMHGLEPSGDGWRARCPAHDDNTPSLSITIKEDGKTLVHCHAGCTYEDVLAALDVDKSELRQVRRVEAVYPYVDEDGVTLFEVVRYRPKDFTQRRPDGRGGYVYSLGNVRRVPYRLPDVRKAIADGEPIAIVEGEKDADRLWSIGIPATTSPGGAKKWRQDHADALADAHVCIIPDNDAVGRQHAEAVAGTFDAIVMVDLRQTIDKADVSDWLDAGHTADELRVLMNAQPQHHTTPTGSEVLEVSGQYVVEAHVGKEIVSRPISDFVFTPVQCTNVDGDDAQTIFMVRTGGEEVRQLPSALFASKASFKRWCNGRGLEWSGTEKDLEGVFALLNRANVERRTGVTVLGLHDGAFVLPDEVIGRQDTYAYVEPRSGAEAWKNATNLRSGAWDGRVLELVAQLHRPEIMTPILGWVAMAPLRSLCRNFPPLGVTGPSGNGKTTLLETMLKAFGFWTKGATNLKGLSPYAVTALAGSSNALPVWFDEYRANSASPDTRAAIEQVLRDAWDGSTGYKGGGNRDNVMALTATTTCAPIIVSGEDSFTETSHLERIVVVNVPSKGRNVYALAELMAPDRHGLPLLASAQGMGRDYLTWLLSRLEEAPWTLTPRLVFDRAEYGRSLVEFGYGLLDTFLIEMGMDVDLPKFDAGRVKAEQAESVKLSPVEDAIEEAMDVYIDGKPLAWEDRAEGYVYVRVGALCKWTDKSTDIKLPGGSQAVVGWLKDKRGAVEHNHLLWRRTYRWPIPADTR